MTVFSSRHQRHPYFDRGRTSRAICILGLTACWITCGVCLFLGINNYRHRTPFTITFSRTERELVVLCISIVVSLFNEVLGYIHGLSLRWALQREGRLTFNSNLRLFSSTKTSTSIPNAWYTNVSMISAMVVSYASAPLIILNNLPSYDPGSPEGLSESATIVGVAVITCSSALLLQALVVTCCLFSARIPTWSSDPLDTVAACIAQGSVIRVPGRCMRSVHDASQPTVPVYPTQRQRPAYRAHERVKTIIKVNWVMVGQALLLLVIVVIVVKDKQLFDTTGKWYFFPGDDTPRWAAWFWGFDEKTGNITGPQWAAGLGILIACQAMITVAMHCAELQVNCARDENAWRESARPSGLRRDMNIVARAVSSWETMVLLVAKPTIHWMYSMAVSSWIGAIIFQLQQIVYLIGMAVLLCVFVTAIANRKPKGPQPAAYGHLQTLANLVDNWPNEGERMYWGDSGLSRNRNRHAGTSTRPLGQIKMGELYS